MWNNRLTRWIYQSADVRCKSYIFFTTIGSFVSRAVQFGRPPFFSDKTNFLNQVRIFNLLSTFCSKIFNFLALIHQLQFKAEYTI